MTVEVFAPSDGGRLARALALRDAVFVREQSVPAELECDEHDAPDAGSVHVLAVDAGGETLGTGRLVQDASGTAQVGRMAVRADARGKGVGDALLAALVREAARRGCTAVRLLAQVHARGFYERAGFRDDGEPVWDAGILHQPMSRPLAPSRKPVSRS